MKTYRVVAIFTLRPLYPWRKTLRYPLNSRLGGPHSRSWRSGKRKHPLSLLGIEPRFLGLKMRLIGVTDTCVPQSCRLLRDQFRGCHYTQGQVWLRIFIRNDDRWRGYSQSVRLETFAVTSRHLTGWLLVGAVRNASLTQTVHSEYQATSKLKKVKRRSARKVGSWCL
jgi:hypothetical protein